MKILILLNNSFENDSRVKRLIDTLKENKNYKILLLCLSKPYLSELEINGNVTIKRIDFKKTWYLKLFYLMTAFPIIFKKKLKKNEIQKTYLLKNLFKSISKLIKYSISKLKSKNKNELNKENILIFCKLLIHYIIFYSKKLLYKTIQIILNILFLPLILPVIILFVILFFINKSFYDKFSLKIRSIYWYFETDFYNLIFKKHAINFYPDIVHCNDLSTLKSGFTIQRKTNAKIIYDSHELELSRNSSFGSFTLAKREIEERKLIRKCDAVITVSESIADYLKTYYSIPKPFIIYNTPYLSKKNFSENLINNDLEKIRTLSQKFKLIIYVGLVTVNRGIEQLIEASEYLDKNLKLVFLGPVNHKFIEQIYEKYKLLISKHKILFFPPLDSSLILNAISYASISVLPIQNICKSYDFCFPNKLLESVYAKTPVAVANLTELSRFVKNYKCGEIFNEKNPIDIAKTINLMIKKDKNYYTMSNKKIIEVNTIYSWSSQKQKILKIYKDLS